MVPFHITNHSGMKAEYDRPMKLEGERCAGFEHHVWMNPQTGIVSKIPSRLGQIWQDMRPEAVERDLGIMSEFDIPTVDTKVYGPQTVTYSEGLNQNAGETRTRARYVLKQPLIRPARPMTYADLLHTNEHRQTLVKLMQQRESIKKEHGLGLDLLGGRGFRLIGPALNPHTKTMRADISNLLVAETDIHTNGHWAEYTEKAASFVARKGEVLLCDTRLMPIGEASTRFEKTLSPLMKRNQEFQDAALWATLEGLGVNRSIIRADERFDNGFKRFVRKLTLHATPKMIAEAEKNELTDADSIQYSFVRRRGRLAQLVRALH